VPSVDALIPALYLKGISTKPTLRAKSSLKTRASMRPPCIESWSELTIPWFPGSSIPWLISMRTKSKSIGTGSNATLGPNTGKAANRLKNTTTAGRFENLKVLLASFEMDDAERHENERMCDQKSCLFANHSAASKVNFIQALSAASWEIEFSAMGAHEWSPMTSSQSQSV